MRFMCNPEIYEACLELVRKVGEASFKTCTKTGKGESLRSWLGTSIQLWAGLLYLISSVSSLI